MKFCITVLLLSSLYLATALSNNSWILIRQGIADNSPFGALLDQIGGQNNLGQAADTGLFSNVSGNVSNLYNSWYQYQNGSNFNYSAELQLTLGNVTIDSQYVLSQDNTTGAWQIVYWSLQYLYGQNNLPAGVNITYDLDSGNITVLNFAGIDEWVEYQEGNNTNLDQVIYNNLTDYQENYLGYVVQNVSNYTTNATLANAVNVSLAGVATNANLTNANFTNILTLGSYLSNDGTIWVRTDADIDSDSNSGEVVAVVSCPAGDDCSNGVLQYWWWKSVLLA